MRRLPVYLLLDTSGSMYGEPIEAVKNGVQTLISTLRSDPYALETAYISIITFNSSAQQITPLTELASFQQPNIDASGCTVQIFKNIVVQSGKAHITDDKQYLVILLPIYHIGQYP